MGKIESIYGKSLSKTIVNSFNTSIFLRTTDPDTSQWVSRILGEQETREHHSTTKSSGKGLSSFKDHESKTESVHRKYIYLPSEISNFDSMVGILKIPGWPLAKLKWPLNNIPNHNPIKEDADWVNEKPAIDHNFDEELEGQSRANS